MNFHGRVDQIISEFDAMSYRGSAIGICFAGGAPTKSFFSYAPEFLKEYGRQELARSDATLRFGFGANGIAQWRDIEAQAEDKRAFVVARQYGIRDGVCFSLTVEGKKTIASLSQDPDNPLSPEQIDKAHDLLTLASVYVSQAIAKPTISSKTLEWIKLASIGLKDNEVATRLDLSIHGARARRKSALLELEAETPAQAIVSAIATRGLSVYELV